MFFLKTSDPPKNLIYIILMRNRVGFMQLNKWRRKKNSQSRDRSINHWTSYPYCGVDEVKIRIAKLKNKKRKKQKTGKGSQGNLIWSREHSCIRWRERMAFSVDLEFLHMFLMFWRERGPSPLRCGTEC